MTNFKKKSFDAFLSIIKEKIPSVWQDFSASINKELLYRYYQFLEDCNEKGGFFSKKDSANIIERHIIDSICFVYYVTKKNNVSRETFIADIGTGPGLPGFVFLCLINTPKITFIDSQKRRLHLVEQEFSDSCPQSSFRYNRVEELRKLQFDIIVSRAVVPYPFSVEIVCRLVRKGGFFVPFLGKLNYEKSMENKMLRNTGFIEQETLEITELDFLGKRHIKFLKKDKAAINGYPRAWKTISKEIKAFNG